MSNERENYEHHVRVSAYHLWENDGRPEGRDGAYWDDAEKLYESDTISLIQDTKLVPNSSSPLKIFKNTTGEPHTPLYLNYKI